MSEGTVVGWRKRVGEHIAEGEALAQIVTAKVEVELESPETGVLTEILVSEGETVPIYTALAVIDVADENVG